MSDKLKIKKELSIEDYQEALDNLKTMGDKDLYNERHLEWAEILQDAVNKIKYNEKETPKKPIKEIVHDTYGCEYEKLVCPVCNEDLVNEVEDKYYEGCSCCPNCGQKLDWDYKIW